MSQVNSNPPETDKFQIPKLLLLFLEFVACLPLPVRQAGAAGGEFGT